MNPPSKVGDFFRCFTKIVHTIDSANGESCWFELVVWGILGFESGTPKAPNRFHFRGFQESKPPGPKPPIINHYLTLGKTNHIIALNRQVQTF